MTPLDAGVAIAGGLAHTIERRVGSRRATWGVVLGLLALSAIPTVIIGSSQRPTDLTFEDVSIDRIPAMTSWVRLEGELRRTQAAGGYLYQLHDSRDDALYVIVIADELLGVGHVVVTGRLSTSSATTGNIGSIEVDIPAVPKANEPFELILLPAALGMLVVVGMRLGYPVVRHERASRSAAHAVPLAADDRLPARWSGRIGSEVVRRDEPMSCTIAVAAGAEVSELTLNDGRAERTVRIRRSAPMRRVRLCRVGGCEPGLDIFAQTADLTVAFDDKAARDRLAATLQ